MVTSNWWLSSPNNYNGSLAFEWNVNYSSGNLNNNNVNNSNAFRPRFLLCRIFNNIYYVNVIIKYKKITDIIEQIKFLKQKYLTNNKLNLDIDFNPNQI